MNFVLIGAAGYVAPKHMQAIKDVGGNLIAALDPHDSVGVLDQYFPECAFFTEFERFDRFCSKTHVDYISICSPNYLHDAHCRFALRLGADAICEKPVVLNERNLDELIHMERLSGQWTNEGHDAKVFNILQLRVHPVITGGRILCPSDQRVAIEVDYVTPRGTWYDYSWKADEKKSGGLATNIGVHLFDLCSYLYGKMQSVSVVEKQETFMRGELILVNADVSWRLSINRTEQPRRLFRIDGKDYDLNGGFHNLHTKVYQHILEGRGFDLETAREAIRICEAIRHA